MTATNNVVENETDDGPGHVVDSAGRRDRASSAEDDGEADQFEVGVLPLEANEPLNKGTCSSDKEEEYETTGRGGISVRTRPYARNERTRRSGPWRTDERVR